LFIIDVIELIIEVIFFCGFIEHIGGGGGVGKIIFEGRGVVDFFEGFEVFIDDIKFVHFDGANDIFFSFRKFSFFNDMNDVFFYSEVVIISFSKNVIVGGKVNLADSALQAFVVFIGVFFFEGVFVVAFFDVVDV